MFIRTHTNNPTFGGWEDNFKEELIWNSLHRTKLYKTHQSWSNTSGDDDAIWEGDMG